MYYQLATAYFRLQDYNKAFQAIRNAVGVYNSREKRAQIYLLYGNIQLQRGKLKSAVKRLRLAVREKPKDPRFHATLGTALEQSGDLAGAETEFEKAVALNPKHHGGMEWVHLEVVRFRRQLQRSPLSHIDRPFLSSFKGVKSASELEAARRFAVRLAPELPLRAANSCNGCMPDCIPDNPCCRLESTSEPRKKLRAVVPVSCEPTCCTPKK